MNEFEYELMTRVAFGEEEPGDREKLEEIFDVNPHAREEFKEMQLAHAGLNDLKFAVPDCQYSSAQLKEALLHKGLHREKPTFSIPWSGVAGVAAACLIAFVVLKAVPNTRFNMAKMTEEPKKSSPITAPPTEIVSPSDAAAPEDSVLPDDPLAMVTDSNLEDELGQILFDLPPSSMPTLKGNLPSATPAPEVFDPSVGNLARISPMDAGVAPATAAENRPAPRKVDPAAFASTDGVVVVGDELDPVTGAEGAIETVATEGVEFSG
jgi:hypothetical protein